MTSSQTSEPESVENKRLESLLKEHDVARITGMSLGSIRRWRLFRRGPRYIKIGSAVRYRPDDVERFLNSRPSAGGAER